MMIFCLSLKIAKEIEAMQYHTHFGQFTIGIS